MPRRIRGDLPTGRDAAREAHDIRSFDQLLTGGTTARLDVKHLG